MKGLSRRVVVMAVATGMTALMAGSTAHAQGAAGQSAAAAVERGKYLVMGMGCHDCHTPHKMGPNGPEPDMTRQLSGHHDGPMTPPAAPAAPWMFTGTGTFTVAACAGAAKSSRSSATGRMRSMAATVRPRCFRNWRLAPADISW